MAEDHLPEQNQAETSAGVFGEPDGETPTNFQGKANSNPSQHGPPRASHGQASNQRAANGAAGESVRQEGGGGSLQNGGQPAPSGQQLGGDRQTAEARPEAPANEGEGVPPAAPPPPVAAASLDSSAPAAAGSEHPPPRDSHEGCAARIEGQTPHSDVTQEPIIVSVGDRRVKLSSEGDPSSLYSLCRKWVRNRPGEDEELGFAPVVPSVLPKPLPAEQPNERIDAIPAVDAQDLHPPRLIPRDLLKAHVQRFREVRKRKREEWQQRVKRYKPRLCLIFPPGAAAVADKKDGKAEARR